MKTVRRSSRQQARFELDHHLPYLMNRAGNLVIQMFSRDLAPLGLTVPMWRTLAVLAKHGELRLTDLATLTSIEISTLSRIIGTMSRRKFVTRGIPNANRREVSIAITETGKGALAVAVPIALDYERELTAGVDLEDVEASKRMLRIAFERLLARSGLEKVVRPRRQDG